MSDSNWTDRIVGARMSVDQEFSSRIAQSELSSQQWSLVMTATELEIENPDDPENARMVANTDKVDQIMPELENIESGMGAMGGGGAGGAGSGSGSSGGLVDSIKGALGLGGGGSGVDDAKRDAAEQLTTEYADELQTQIESNGQWDSICEAAASETSDER
ncbi:hypothetical protein G6M89_01585 [Natronolimnobius sp. AArcel1]|uniref:DUF5799 family protein n=1 Tax=Natronolimnobius sp. AArcel1 TaxID=1679093 RepID=UPI0013EBACAE|nr:DUF5799 family protein [Natronolimnobius sp. AArcel1]NGM67712.1 hypothetical protein [Natronolimnobius sp. AArcel1]